MDKNYYCDFFRLNTLISKPQQFVVMTIGVFPQHNAMRFLIAIISNVNIMSRRLKANG